MRVTVDQEGKTRIHDKYVVSAPLSGRILRITLDPGDKVEASKTLLTMIEPRTRNCSMRGASPKRRRG